MNNLFLFTGTETFLMQEQLNSWKNAFLEKYGDLNLITLDAANSKSEEMIPQLVATPFLADKRLIFVENFPPTASTKKTSESKKKVSGSTEEDRWIKAIEEIPETNVVVFIQPKPDKRKKLYKELNKKVQIKEFVELDEYELAKWVEKRIKSQGGLIDPSTVHYFIQLAGRNLWHLDNEIQKLALYSNQQSITKEMIDELVIPSAEANIFQFTDALSSGGPNKAIDLLHRLIDSGQGLMQVFYMIIRQYRLLIQAADHMQNPLDSNMAKALGVHPFVAKKLSAQVDPKKELVYQQAYAELLDIDYRLKTSKIKVSVGDQREFLLALEKFILKYSRST